MDEVKSSSSPPEFHEDGAAGTIIPPVLKNDYVALVPLLSDSGCDNIEGGMDVEFPNEEAVFDSGPSGNNTADGVPGSNTTSTSKKRGREPLLTINEGSSVAATSPQSDAVGELSEHSKKRHSASPTMRSESDAKSALLMMHEDDAYLMWESMRLNALAESSAVSADIDGKIAGIPIPEGGVSSNAMPSGLPVPISLMEDHLKVTSSIQSKVLGGDALADSLHPADRSNVANSITTTSTACSTSLPAWCRSFESYQPGGLIRAIKKSNYQLIRTFVQQPFAVDVINEEDRTGMTPIHACLLFAKPRELALLLSLASPYVLDCTAQDAVVTDNDQEDSNSSSSDTEEPVGGVLLKRKTRMAFIDFSKSYSDCPLIHLALKRFGASNNYIARITCCYLVLLSRRLKSLQVVHSTSAAKKPDNIPSMSQISSDMPTPSEGVEDQPREGFGSGESVYFNNPLFDGPISLTKCWEYVVRECFDGIPFNPKFLPNRKCYASLNIDALDYSRANVLSRATFFASRPLTRLFLVVGCSVVLDFESSSAIATSVRSRSADVLRLLLKSCVRQNTNNIPSETSPDEIKGDEDDRLFPVVPQSHSLSSQLVKETAELCVRQGCWSCLNVLTSEFRLFDFDKDQFEEFAVLSETCGYGMEFPEFISRSLDGPESELLSDGPLNGFPETMLLTHSSCMNHLKEPRLEATDLGVAEKYYRRWWSQFPENPTRLEVLIDQDYGILNMQRLSSAFTWLRNPAPANIADVLRVHDWGYVNKLQQTSKEALSLLCTSNDLMPYRPVPIDNDTHITSESWEAARSAAGVVIEAVRNVCLGKTRNAFCIVRPPGHHLGTWGAAQAPPTHHSEGGVSSESGESFGSQGFCLLNNIAIGASYARYHYEHIGINKIAIFDFDVHHGNGTEQIIRNLVPSQRKIRHFSPIMYGGSVQVNVNCDVWKPWRNEEDPDNILFISIHGYDGVFYPATGAARRETSPSRIINIPYAQTSSLGLFRERCEKIVFPEILAFSPDLIMISAGFDGHAMDGMGQGFSHCLENDFMWMTEQLVSISNECCDGRIVSVLEGGYNTLLGTNSPFARSVLAHAEALKFTSPKYPPSPDMRSSAESVLISDSENGRAVRSSSLGLDDIILAGRGSLPPEMAATTALVHSTENPISVEGEVIIREDVGTKELVGVSKLEDVEDSGDSEDDEYEANEEEEDDDDDAVMSIIGDEEGELKE